MAFIQRVLCKDESNAINIHRTGKENEIKKTNSLVLVLALGLTSEVVNADFTFGTPIPLSNVNIL